MLIVVGLGNPGRQYAAHRHNVGFMALDEIHRRHGFAPWRSRFHAEIAEGTLGGEKALLVKPQTYMNESGRAVGEAARFYKVEAKDVLVIHDEIDLRPGQVRMKSGGGTAGHNGLRSVGAALGEGFRRLRIGVGHPGVKELVHIHVLHDFAKDEYVWLDPLIAAIADNAPLLARGEDQTFANRLNEALAPVREEKKEAREAAGKSPKNKKPKAAAPAEASDAGSSGARESSDAPAVKPKGSAGGAKEGPLARGLKRLFGARG